MHQDWKIDCVLYKDIAQQATYKLTILLLSLKKAYEDNMSPKNTL